MGTILRFFTTIINGVAATTAPSQFALSQNYPNPFNPATTIAYEVPSAAHVTLIVYDMLGRQVAVLVNEMKQPGSYSAVFDASALANGMYIARLTSGGARLHIKMLHVK
jgi:hypothetical protein